MKSQESVLMPQNRTPSWLLVTCSSMYLLGTLIGYGSVNSTSVELIPIGRAFALTITAVLLAIYFSNGKMHRSALMGIVLFIILFLYGIFRGLPYFGSMYAISDYIVSATVIVIGIVIFSLIDDIEIQVRTSKILIFFFLIWSLILFLSGGINLNLPPSFSYDIRQSNDNLMTSSQGLTKFYAIAGILSLSLSMRFSSKFRRSGYAVFFVFFTFLSFLAGSRGEFLFLVVVIALNFLSGSWKRKLFAAILFYPMYLFFIWGMENLADQMTAFSRFKLFFIGGDLSMRDILFSQALDLIANDPKCLLVGCGFAHFQFYYGYDYGLYPHNSILEAVITWGLPLFLILFTCILFGARSISWFAPVSLVGLISLLISFKSGDLMGGWLAMSFIFNLAGRGLHNAIGMNRSFQWQLK